MKISDRKAKKGKSKGVHRTFTEKRSRGIKTAGEMERDSEKNEN